MIGWVVGGGRGMQPGIFSLTASPMSLKYILHYYVDWFSARLFTNQNFVTYLKSGSIILSKTKRKNLVQFSSAKLIIMLLVSIIYHFA